MRVSSGVGNGAWLCRELATEITTRISFVLRYTAVGFAYCLGLLFCCCSGKLLKVEHPWVDAALTFRIAKPLGHPTHLAPPSPALIRFYHLHFLKLSGIPDSRNQELVYLFKRKKDPFKICHCRLLDEERPANIEATR